MTKMNPTVKALWLERLRDPETRQTRGTLNRVAEEVVEEGYPRTPAPVGLCCLGVLCEIAVEQGVIQPGTVNVQGRTAYTDYFLDEHGMRIPEKQTGVLPTAVREWAGLAESNPDVFTDYRTTLASLNDGGTSFPELADIIDQNF